MKFSIFSLSRSQELDITYLEVETTIGNFVFLEGHAPILLLLKPQEPIIFSTTKSPDSREKQFLKNGGILRIINQEAILIISE